MPPLLRATAPWHQLSRRAECGGRSGKRPYCCELGTAPADQPCPAPLTTILPRSASPRRGDRGAGAAMTPKTRYARSGDLSIAYQVVGGGPMDLVVVPGWISNIEVFWEDPHVARFFENLATFAR